MNYYPSKANVVAYALSWKSLYMSALTARELDLIEQLRELILVCKVTADNVKLDMLKLTSGFLDEIRENQNLDVTLVDRLSSIN